MVIRPECFLLLPSSRNTKRATIVDLRTFFSIQLAPRAVFCPRSAGFLATFLLRSRSENLLVYPGAHLSSFPIASETADKLLLLLILTYLLSLANPQRYRNGTAELHTSSLTGSPFCSRSRAGRRGYYLTSDT